MIKRWKEEQTKYPFAFHRGHPQSGPLLKTNHLLFPHFHCSSSAPFPDLRCVLPKLLWTKLRSIGLRLWHQRRYHDRISQGRRFLLLPLHLSSSSSSAFPRAAASKSSSGQFDRLPPNRRFTRRSSESLGPLPTAAGASASNDFACFAQIPSQPDRCSASPRSRKEKALWRFGWR